MRNGSLALSRKGKMIGVIAAILFVIAGFFGLALSAHADAGDVPAHSKSITDNHDGTYQLELTVTGDADNETLNNSHVNVLIVYDESSSMSNGAGNGYSRADNAENAVYTFVNGLVGYQARGVDICMAEVGFGTGANTRQNWTTSLTTIRGHYDQGLDGNVNRSAHGNYGYNGTNWAQALDRANTLLDGLDNVGGQDRSAYPTFVILVTDGAPTASPGNSTTVPGPNVPWINYRPHYRAAVDDALSIQSRENTSLYGIYAFGTDANLLDDLMYYANTGNHRVINNVNINTTNNQNAYNFGNDDGADKYYTAANPQALDDAIADIFNVIVQAMGIADVSMSDGTTNQVTTSSGEVAELLEVDEDSYQYWMTIPLDANNQFKRTKNVGGNAETITYTVNGSTVTWTEGGASKSVTLDGSVENHQFKFEWTKDDFPNDFYEFAPEDAELVNGAVDWDLSNVGTLLDGVTYSVTFDVYPSQTALDYKARLDNGEDYIKVVDSNLRQYMDANGNLKTNTDAKLTYSDTRLDNPGPKTERYTNPDPVVTESSSMTVEKEWEGDSAPAVDLKLDILADGDEANPFYEATLNSAGNWQATFNISCGLIVDGEALPGALGHDFTFAELDDTQYRWELHAPTVRPMEIDGAAEPTILIKADPANGYDPTGKTQYTIGGATYYVDPAISTLTATNHRRSNLNLTKVVTGEDAPSNATFPFELQVNNSKAPTAEPTDDPDHNSDYWLWFSIYDTKAGATVMDATVSGDGLVGPNADGYYYLPSKNKVTVQMKDDWNLRFINLPTGTTYTFTEGDTDEFAFVKAENTGAADSTFSGGQTSTGTIEKYDAKAYEVTFTNDYQRTDLEITKVWNDGSNQDGLRPSADAFKNLLTLSPAVQGAEPTVVDNSDNTYTITYKDLPRYSNGQVVTYTVAESAITGYSTEGSPAQDHGTITNSHTPEVTEVTVVKEWDDSDDIGKIRPTSIQAQLTADGAASGDPVTLNAGNEWTYTWENLPKFKDGEEIDYAADETAVPTGYTKSGPVKSTDDDGATFTVTNTYAPTPVSVDPPVQKVIEGTDALYNKGDFTFTIEATSPTDAPMPENPSITNSATYEVDGKTGYYEFGEIEFTMPGTYTYTVKESGTVAGVTNDSAGAQGKAITFTVEDDGNGNLTVTPTTDQVQLSFTNVYDATGTANLAVTKAVAGAAWPQGKTLTLTLTGSDGAPMPETKTATLTAAGDVTFGPISYGLSDAGQTYTYTITEDGFGTGWTSDPESKAITATVKVTDNGDGTLGTDVSYDPADATFTNTYKAEGSTDITVTKELAGAAWPSGKSLTLTLTGAGDAPMPETTTATLTAAGDVTFGPISYTEADSGKEYTYTVSEGNGFGSGWTGSGDVTVTVKVNDDGEGTLTPEVTYSPENATITNTYEAEGEATISVTKALAGADWPEGKTITFTLAADEGVPMPESDTVEATEAGEASFGAIAYDESDAGKTYTYTITEDGFGTGWSGSPSSITATVKVTDNGDGTLDADVTYDPTNATFTNTYKAEGTGSFTATKELVVPDGMTGPTDASWTFELTADDGVPMPETKSYTVAAGETVTFGDIDYTEADAGKTYTYTVTESGTVPGVTNDETASKTVTVTVNDEGDGTLTTTVSPEDGLTFTNTYGVEAAELELKAGKTLEVEDPANNPPDVSGEYTLTLAATGDAPLPEGASDGKVEITNADGNGTATTFGTIKFTKPGEFQYTVSESGTVDGVTNGETSYTVKVKVSDNGDGSMSVEIMEGEAETVFTNTYKVTSVDKGLEVGKVLTGKKLTAGAFTFTLTGSDGAPMPENDEATNDADGMAVFDDITFEEPGTYTYTISEEEGSLGGVTYDESTVTATVEVKDNGKGALEATVVYDPEDATFTNTYDANGKFQPTVKKELNGRTLEDGQFEFELLDEDGEVLQTKTNDKSGSVLFDEIEYKLSDLEPASSNEPQPLDEPEPAADVTTTEDEMVGEVIAEETAATEDSADYGEASEEEQPALQLVEVAEAAEADGSAVAAMDDDEPLSKTFTYTIREKNGGKPGYEYDDHEVTVTVTVTDNGDGTLNVDENYEGSQTFTNTYKANGSIVLKGEKTVTGTDLAEGQFTFELRDPDNKVQDTQANDSEGAFTFESLDFTEADAGKSYKYQIAEVNDGKAGYTYDSHVCTVTVSITDNGDGTLGVTAEYSDGEVAAFENPYKPLATSAQFMATKTLEGRDLVADEFSFELADSEGNVVKTATNAADGTINFGSVEFDEAGTYTFTATEVKGDDSQITYDSSIKTYTVEVTDENGQLVANVTCDEDNPTFANTYQKKEEPVVPKTGDNLPLTALLTLAIGSGAAAVVARRRSMFAVEKANAGAHAQVARRNSH